MKSRRPRVSGPDRFAQHPGIALAVSVALLAALAYGAFVRRLPGTHHFTISALVSSSEGLISGSPVREAGINVGQVGGLAPGPDHTARVTMEIDPTGLPIHSDATARVRPRVFLEGDFYVDLAPGSPVAPAMGDGATIPLSHTTVEVQADQIFSTFPSSIRAGQATLLHELNLSLLGGGAGALRRIAQELPGTFRESTITAEGWQGTMPGDTSRLIANLSSVDATLASQRSQLSGLIVNGERTWRVIADHAGDLQNTLAMSDRLLGDAPPTLHAADAALPVVRRFFNAATPAFHVLPPSLNSSVTDLRDTEALAQPRLLPRLLTLATPVLRAIPPLEARSIPLFKLIAPVSDCVSSALVPVLNTKLDDGALSSHRPVWQDLLHTTVGVAGAGENFDGNGGYYRFEGGGSDQYVSFGDVPGLGPTFGTASLPLLGVRPHWNGPTPPPLRPDVACATQGVPSLQVGPWQAEPSQALPASDRLTPSERSVAMRVLRGVGGHR